LSGDNSGFVSWGKFTILPTENKKTKKPRDKRGFSNSLIQLSATFLAELKQKEFSYVRYNDG